MSGIFLAVAVIGLLLLPFLVEKIIVDGLFGLTLFTTTFENDTWFSFWGSYLGAIITVIVLWITIKYNKRDTENRLKEYDIDRRYDNILESIEELYNFVLLKETNDVNKVYKILVDTKKYQLIFHKCINETEACRFYLLYEETIVKYLEQTQQFNGINLTSENIAEYAEKYKIVSKELTHIMHSVKNELDEEYAKIKDFIESKRKTEKMQLYKSRSIKELFKCKKVKK